MFKTVLPVGFSSSTSQSPGKADSRQPLGPEIQNSQSLNSLAGDRFKLKSNSSTANFTHTIPISHGPLFSGEKDDAKALWNAAKQNDLPTAKSLLARGVGFDVPLSSWDSKPILDSPAIHQATLHTDTQILQLFLDNGAYEESTIAGNPDRPIHYAAKNGNLNAVKLLRKRGALLKVKGKDNRTPLFYAVENAAYNTALIQFLLDEGSDPDQAALGKKPDELTSSQTIKDMFAKARRGPEPEPVRENPTEVALKTELAEVRRLKTQRSTDLKAQITEARRLKTQRSTNLKAQIAEEKEQAQQRENELRQDYEKQLADAQALGKELSTDKEDLKLAYAEHVREIREGSQAKIKTLEAQIARELEKAQERIAGLEKQLQEAKDREQQVREDFKTQRDNYLELTRGRIKNQEDENERLRRDKSALRQNLEGKLTEKEGQLESARERSRERNALLAGLKTDKTHLQEWLLETRKALEAEKAKSEKLSKDLLAKSTQAAIQRGRAEGGRSKTITLSDGEPEVRIIADESTQLPTQNTVLDRSETQSNASSHDPETVTTVSEGTDSRRPSLNLDERPKNTAVELSGESMSLSQQERFKQGLQQLNQDYEDSTSDHAASLLSSQSDSASQISVRSTASRLSLKSIASSLWNRDHNVSSDEIASREAIEDRDNPSCKLVKSPSPRLRKSSSTLSLQSNDSNTSDVETGPVYDSSRLASMYTESKKDRHFNLLDALYNDDLNEFKRILGETPSAWKQRDLNQRGLLHWAALLNRHAFIDTLLAPLNTEERQRLLNTRDRDGLTPLLYAADQNSVETADILANRYGADTSIKGGGFTGEPQNVFHRAAEKGRSHLIQALAPNAPMEILNDASGDSQTTALMDLARLGKPKASRMLLKRDGINTLARDKSHRDAFYLAVENAVKTKNWKTVEKFLIRKAKGLRIPFDAHFDGLDYSAFSFLISHAPEPVIELALSFRKFNLNQSIVRHNWATGHEFLTPLYFAIEKGHMPGVKALLADDRLRPETLTQVQKRNILHAAMKSDQREMVELICALDFIKDLEKRQDYKGWSPKRLGIRNAATGALEAFQERRPGGLRPLKYRQGDVDVAKMKDREKAGGLKKFLEEKGKRIPLR